VLAIGVAMKQRLVGGFKDFLFSISYMG